MKNLHKIFAVAAIAAASMFTTQNACAAVLDDGDNKTEATITETAEADLTFVMYLGSDFAPYDEMIADNPNRNEIVKLGVELHNLVQADAITEDEKVERMEQLYMLGCGTQVLLALCIVM